MFSFFLSLFRGVRGRGGVGWIFTLLYDRNIDTALPLT